MINELWRPLQDDPNQNFAISNHGRVQHMPTGEIVEQFIYLMDGYLYVNLNDGMWAVHQLVAESFICCLDCDFWKVVHIDGDETNNMEWNLRLSLDEEEYEFWRNNCE